MRFELSHCDLAFRFLWLTQMMGTLVGELTLALKHGEASALRDRSLCPSASIKSRRPVHLQSMVCHKNMGFRGCGVLGKGLGFGLNVTRAPLSSSSRNWAARARSAAMGNPMFSYLGEFKGFAEELRFQAMRLHAKEQASERVAKRGPSVESYLKFLVNSKRVYETMEAIITNSSHPSCESSSITSQ